MVTAGRLNAGKLISTNTSMGIEKLTAMLAVGIMCDTAEEIAMTGNAMSCSVDMVGSCEIDDIAESTGAE